MMRCRRRIMGRMGAGGKKKMCGLRMEVFSSRVWLIGHRMRNLELRKLDGWDLVKKTELFIFLKVSNHKNVQLRKKTLFLSFGYQSPINPDNSNQII